MDGLRELGWTEGENLSVERRYADGRTEVLPALADDLVRRDPDVIVTGAQQATFAVQQRTATIPIVAQLGGDPVAAGLVASLARPGGNLTGLKSLSGPGSVKGVELLEEIVPGLVHLAFIRDASNPATLTGSIPAVREVTQALGLQVLELDVRTAADVPGAMAMATSWGAEGLYVSLSTLMRSIVDVGAVNHLPGAYVQHNYVEAGGLLCYATRLSAMFRRSATFVDKILRGSATPRELPIEEATVFDLSINVTTAQALGLTIPPSVLPLVTEWIE